MARRRPRPSARNPRAASNAHSAWRRSARAPAQRRGDRAQASASADAEAASSRDWSPVVERSGELIARVELEFAEDAGEVTLDGAVGDEQNLCDLPVGEVLAGELGDPTLARCERLEPGQDDPPGPRAGGPELGLGARRESCRAGAVGAVEGLAEELSRLRPPIAPAQSGGGGGAGRGPVPV